MNVSLLAFRASQDLFHDIFKLVNDTLLIFMQWRQGVLAFGGVPLAPLTMGGLSGENGRISVGEQGGKSDELNYQENTV